MRSPPKRDSSKVFLSFFQGSPWVLDPGIVGGCADVFVTVLHALPPMMFVLHSVRVLPSRNRLYDWRAASTFVR